MPEKPLIRKAKDASTLSQKPLVTIENISKQFPHTDSKAVDDISISIYEGELFALLGPSGCGKTTLMRMIAGFETPTSGRILIDGVDMTNVPPYKRPVNMMFQSYALFPHMTVEQNIAFGLKQEKNLSNEEIRHRVVEALEMVKMGGFGHRKPRELSGGQQQRVALARSLVKRPKLLLLDEPLGALDRKTREHTQMELINIQDMLGITFVIVTHDQEEALVLSNRIAVMESGQLLQVGSPEEIYEYPRSRFIADFIGSINMFEGTVRASRCPAGYITVDSPEAGVDLRVQSTEDIPVGTQVWVAVRPEEMEIDTTPAPPNENQVIGKIVDVSFLGDKIIYHVILPTGKVVSVSIPTAARSKNADFVEGNSVYLSWYDSDGVALTA